MLKKDAETSWIGECHKAFEKIKEYLSIPPVLVLPELGRLLLLYLSVLDGALGCVLGQHDETKRREQAIYYLSKKFTPYEARYSLLEHTCSALTWTTQKLRKLAKWQVLLSKFAIIYVTQKAVKGQALADHLAENPVGGEYEPLKMYFPDEEVSFVGEDIAKAYDDWRMFFNGATNFKGAEIGVVLVSEIGQHYPISAKIRFPCTNNMTEYEACIMGLNLAIDINMQELLDKMSGSINRVENDYLENHGENGVAVPVVGAPPQNPDNSPRPIPVDAGSQDVQHVNETSHTDRSIQHGDQQEA
ncbi:uncharacterized protein [Nicotiana sylvestris]|uniref:uncharacterized protein n=1 Tax=Nicotiana sylvestris TaxID=4096 RepID=UPI00388C6277